jgi:hypothetical protein
MEKRSSWSEEREGRSETEEETISHRLTGRAENQLIITSENPNPISTKLNYGNEMNRTQPKSRNA